MDLIQNPFFLLAATPRDNRRRIMELAEERSLLLNSSELMQARSDLTNPRKRLSAEVAWLPGLGPKRADEVLSMLESSVKDILSVDNLTTVAHANLLAAGLSRLSDYTLDNITKWILELAYTFEEIEPEVLCADINEERIVSGFPEVTDLSIVEAEIQERRHYYRRVIKSALDNIASKELVEAVTDLIESATDDGEEQAPILIDDLIDLYEVEAQEFLEKEEANIKILVDKIRNSIDADKPDSTLEPLINELIQVVKNWDLVAQPIQVSTKSRGLDHDASLRVARLVRSLAIDMFNEHGKLEFSQQLTNMLQEVFTEVVEVADRTIEDVNALDEIAERRKLSQLLDPISDLCRTAYENSEKNPSSANNEAQKIINTAPQLVSKLETLCTSTEIISQGKDEIGIILMQCAIIYGNKTENWNVCVSILEEALNYASNKESTDHIIKNLDVVRKNARLYRGLKPISSAPSLRTINGMGLTLYGSTDHDSETGSYLSTYYFVILAIPIFPICRYRVIPTNGGYRFLGKAPLRTFDKWHMALVIGIIAWIFFSNLQQNSHQTGVITSRGHETSASSSTSPKRISGSPTPTTPSHTQSNNSWKIQSQLEQEIENGKTRATEMEAQLQVMDDKLTAYDRKLKSYRDYQMTEEYNSLVPVYNSLISKRKVLYNKYDSLVNDINAKVKKYNAGDR